MKVKSSTINDYPGTTVVNQTVTRQTGMNCHPGEETPPSPTEGTVRKRFADLYHSPGRTQLSNFL